MQRFFKLGGLVASVVLIAFGLGAVIIGIQGRAEVRDNIARENIVGSPDMTPDEIRGPMEEAGITDVSVPTCAVAGEEIETGTDAKCFAEYLRIHALESTGGQTYAEMGRFLDEEGNAVQTEDEAATDPETGRPVENQLRNLWVTATALSTAMNTAFFAEQVALFSIVMGVALIITGIGFLVLTFGLARRLAPTHDHAAST